MEMKMICLVSISLCLRQMDLSTDMTVTLQETLETAKLHHERNNEKRESVGGRL